MNRDTVIALAREAHGPITDQWWDMDVAALERFAALVAAHEREACAEKAEGYIYKRTHDGPTARGCAAAIRSRT